MKFWVGQLVRCVKPWNPTGHAMIDAVAALTWEEIKNKEAQVFGLDILNGQGDVGIGISCDGYKYVCPDYGLEPILPEGWKKTHWDQCLWQPEGEEEFEEAFALVQEHKERQSV